MGIADFFSLLITMICLCNNNISGGLCGFICLLIPVICLCNNNISGGLCRVDISLMS